MNNNFKSGFVTIIGKPNVGKSTLVNNLVGEKISIISSKPQTTRNNIRAIYNYDDMQIVFLDTPGIHQPRHKLDEYMVKAAQNSLEDVDCILYLLDCTKARLDEGNKKIIEKLRNVEAPVILIINKIDLIKKEELIKIIDIFSKEFSFKSIIPISARTREGINILLDELKELLPEGPKYFNEDDITDQTERQLAEEIIREKALYYLQEEVPHGISIEIEKMKKRENSELIEIDATIFYEKESHKGIIIGKNGEMLKKIGQAARKDIENMLDSKVLLKTWIKLKENWREDEKFIAKRFDF